MCGFCCLPRPITNHPSRSMPTASDAYTYNTYGELATFEANYGTNALYSVTYDATSATRDALGRVVKKTGTIVRLLVGRSVEIQPDLSFVCDRQSTLN